MSGSCCPNLCHECGLLHHNATVEGCLRIQVKALRAEVAALKAELAKYTEPLTDEQAERAFAIAKENGVGECDTLAHGVQGIDAAIRLVRKGE